MERRCYGIIINDKTWPGASRTNDSQRKTPAGMSVFDDSFFPLLLHIDESLPALHYHCTKTPKSI